MSEIKDREQWLKERINGIGASEASAVIGMNPYLSNIELWQQKTGKVIPEDIGDKPYVKYGIEAEEYIRGLFALDFPEYEVSYNEFDLIRHPEHDFIFATLDGRLIEKATGRKGILEVKTTEILKSIQKESWKEKIPNNYYIQNLHQLLSTGWDFAILVAQLKYNYGDGIDGVKKEIRHYYIDRSEVQEDITYLEEQEVKFWKENVLKNKRPDLILPSI